MRPVLQAVALWRVTHCLCSFLLLVAQWGDQWIMTSKKWTEGKWRKKSNKTSKTTFSIGKWTEWVEWNGYHIKQLAFAHYEKFLFPFWNMKTIIMILFVSAFMSLARPNNKRILFAIVHSRLFSFFCLKYSFPSALHKVLKHLKLL